MPFPLLLLLLVGGAAVVAASSSAQSEPEGLRLAPGAFRKPAGPPGPLAYAPAPGLSSMLPEGRISTTPAGVPIVKSAGAPGMLPLWALTLDGQSWLKSVAGPTFYKGSGKSSGDDWILRAATDYVVPALGVVLTASGGPAGFGAAMALRTWANLARGSRLTDAVIDATQQQLKTAIERGQFGTWVKEFSASPMSRAALGAARAQVAARYTAGGPTQAGALQAFDAAAALARARRLQELTANNLRKRIDPAYHRGLDVALNEGVPLVDWINAYAGDAGVRTFDEATIAIGQKIDEGTA
ncbi:MAG: hypothetical protein RIS45_1641 [Planctomycetota bacterium]|jgi:hypothetical protein